MSPDELVVAIKAIEGATFVAEIQPAMRIALAGLKTLVAIYGRLAEYRVTVDELRRYLGIPSPRRDVGSGREGDDVVAPTAPDVVHGTAQGGTEHGTAGGPGRSTDKGVGAKAPKLRRDGEPYGRDEHGRRGKDDFPDALQRFFAHPDFDRPGSLCPQCREMRVYLMGAVGGGLRFTGRSHLTATCIHREIWRCGNCAAHFPAPLPPEIELDGGSRRVGHTAAAQVAVAKYLYGTPLARQEAFGSLVDLDLPATTLCEMVKGLVRAALPVYKRLFAEASLAGLFFSDDTGARIIGVHEVEKIQRTTGKMVERTGVHTSCVVAVLEGGREGDETLSTPSSLVEIEKTGGLASLTEIGYSLSPDVLGELGRRVGCERASGVVAYPREGSLTSAVAAVFDGRETIYDRLIEELMNAPAIDRTCEDRIATVGEATDDPQLAGLKAVIQGLRARDEMLTILVFDALSGHIVDRPPFGPSSDLWSEYAARHLQTGFEVHRIRCRNCYAREDILAAEALGQIEALEHRTVGHPQPPQRRYLMLGYSKGANIALHALALTPWLRDKTLAVLTVAAPIGGSISVDWGKGILDRLHGLAGGAIAIPPYLWQRPLDDALAYIAESLGNGSNTAVLRRIVETLREWSVARDGFESMRPAVRAEYLYLWLRNQDFTRPSGGDIPVFHVASILDVSRMHPLPLLTVKDGQPALATDEIRVTDALQFLLLPPFVQYPLNDTSVALHHAVLPRDAVPKGLRPELVAVLQTDHLSSGLTGWDNAPGELPRVELVDALFATMAQRIFGEVR